MHLMPGPERGAQSLHRIAVVIALQMLAATLLIPAIRPLFAEVHHASRGAMHAFMALNMLGAAVAVPLVGAAADRGLHLGRAVMWLALADAALLALLAARLPTALILALRTLEGAAHVSTTTLLLAEIARRSTTQQRGRAMGEAGAALILAVACGSGLGTLLLGFDARAPLWAGALLAVGVACFASRELSTGTPAGELGERRERRQRLAFGLLREVPALRAPLAAAFVARFTIGCIVVTFALFAREVHGMSDAAVGGCFALLTFPFALATLPAGWLTDRVSARAALVVGVGAYGVCLLLLPHAARGALPMLMVCAGLGSALIFAALLHVTAELGRDARGSAMALLNVAGCLGMLLGPAVAGVLGALLRQPADPSAGYRVVFAVAAGACLVWMPWGVAWWRSAAATTTPATSGAAGPAAAAAERRS